LFAFSQNSVKTSVLRLPPDNRGASEWDVLIAFLAVSTRGFSPGTALIDKLIPANSQSCAGILKPLKIPDQL